MIVKRSERNKRKYVTGVFGLEAFGVDLKKAAKLFANKFATGASLHKTPQGDDEIIIQGDVSDEVREVAARAIPQSSSYLSSCLGVPQVEEMILDKDDKKAFAVFGGKITEDQIEFQEEKKKVKAPPAIAPQ